MMTLAHLVRSVLRARRGSGSFVGASILVALVVNGGCSNFFGSGPDPAADGRVDGGPVGSGGNTGCNPLGSFDPNSNGEGCESLYSCLQSTCDNSLRACFGSDYQNANFNGAVCQELASCIASNGCNPNSNSGCLNGASAGCKVCLATLVNCENSSCRGAGNSSQCGTPSTGGAGGGGGSSNVTVLASNTQVNAIALDTNTVYFETQSGLAKVNKDATQEQGLGSFTQLSGLGLDANFLYVESPQNNAVLAVPKTGSQTNPPPLASWMCGGGQGSLVLDGSGIYLTSGQALYQVPIAGGSANLLANDVAPVSGPGWGTRVAVDASNVYYAANSMIGGTQIINSIAKSAAPSGTNCGAQSSGKQIATARGTIGAMALASGQTVMPGQTESVLFFTDLTSDGLTPVLIVHATILGSAGMPSTGDLAMLTAPNSNGTGFAGTALAADANGGYLYFGAFDGIYRMACNITACGQPELFVPSALATALAFDGEFLYYGDQNGGANTAPGLKKIAK